MNIAGTGAEGLLEHLVYVADNSAVPAGRRRLVEVDDFVVNLPTFFFFLLHVGIDHLSEIAGISAAAVARPNRIVVEASDDPFHYRERSNQGTDFPTRQELKFVHKVQLVGREEDHVQSLVTDRHGRYQVVAAQFCGQFSRQFRIYAKSVFARLKERDQEVLGVRGRDVTFAGKMFPDERLFRGDFLLGLGLADRLQVLWPQGAFREQ